MWRLIGTLYMYQSSGYIRVMNQSITFALPLWLRDYEREYVPSVDLDKRMHYVVQASRLNIENKTGGPFAAAVFNAQNGELISTGVNLVTSAGLSILHAEMVAISFAQQRLGVYDLGNSCLDLELLSSAEPCAMCSGAIPWSGVKSLVFGARVTDVESTGFDEGSKPVDWIARFEKRGITVRGDVLRADATNVLRAYHDNEGVLY